MSEEITADDLPDKPYIKALLDTGMSPKEIHDGTQLFLVGEFLPIRRRKEEDPELVKQIEAQEPSSVSGVLLDICRKTEPGSATRIYAINRFVFLANGGKGRQRWYGVPSREIQ